MNNINSMFESILSRCIHPPEPKPGDYKEDGIIHCGVCHNPRQKWIEFAGNKQLVPIMCLCEQEADEQQRKADEFQRRKNRIADVTAVLVEMGAADRPVATFAQNDMHSEKNTKTLLRYVSKFDRIYKDNIGLMLYGEAGNGKTFFAECVANALTDAGYFAWMSSIRAISAAMSGNYGENRSYLMRRIQEVDLLILDDFGAERDTSFMNEQVYDVINERYKSGRPLMVTTNLDPSDMAKEQNITAKRIYERVMEMCTPLKIEGGTRRRGNAARKMADLKDILGLEE